MLRLVYENQQWERIVRAACAELQNNSTMLVLVNQARNLIENGCYLYKVEHDVFGSFIGFVIYRGNGIPTVTKVDGEFVVYDGSQVPVMCYARPHFLLNPVIESEFSDICSNVINNN